MAKKEAANKPLKRVQKLTLKKGVSFEDIIKVAVSDKPKKKSGKKQFFLILLVFHRWANLTMFGV